jgi:cytidine deaminase
MKNVEIICRLKEYNNQSELEADDQLLLNEAMSSMNNAYAPYSNFHVGAAVLLDNGKIVKGNNQENASYPTGLCAERVAIFSASANFPGTKIKAIAIAASSENFNVDTPVSPCGSCRQVLAEYEHLFKENIRIIMSGESGKILIAEDIGNLLPFQFNSDDLKSKIK